MKDQAANGLLMQLVMDLRSGYLRRCESLGLNREEMQMLQGLSLEELHYLSGSEVSIISVGINHGNLVRMQQARTEQKRLQRIDRALALGGSIELMANYFGLSSTDVAARRRIAGIDVRRGAVTWVMRKTPPCGVSGKSPALKTRKVLTGWT
jgi:hypothetical protein